MIQIWRLLSGTLVNGVHAAVHVVPLACENCL